MNKKILVVDDEKIIRTVLCRLLHGAGFHAESVEDAKSALKKIDKTKFDLILLDILMPGMGGIDFMKEINNKGNPPDIVIISACQEEALINQTRTLGARGYLKKPFDNIDVILTLIKKVLSE